MFQHIAKRVKSQVNFNMAVDESCDLSSKKIRAENCYSYPYAVDPMLVYYYGPHIWDNAFQTYPVITKDGKTLYIPPENFPPIIQKSMPSFRNRLSLTPANVQKLIPMIKEEQTAFTYHAHKSETLSKRPSLKRDPDQDSTSCCLDSEDAFSDTSFSTLSAGTEDGLVSNIEEEDEIQQHSNESEFIELKKILTEVDALIRTKILSEVETLIAKYRKCLKVAVQGKKLYQMELEKLHYTQKGKLRKLRERNKLLEKELARAQRNSVDNSSEQFESQSSRPTPKCPSSSDPPETVNETVASSIATSAGSKTSTVDATKSEELNVDIEVNKTITGAPSPTLPKLSPDLQAEPLCQ